MTSTSNSDYQESPAITPVEGALAESDSPEPAPLAEQQKEQRKESYHLMPCNPPNPPKELDEDAGQRGRSKSRRTLVHPSHRYHQTMVTRSREAGQLLKLRFDVSAVSTSAHRYRSASRSQSVDRSQQHRGA
jgi:hypothetical protein